jgi:hypothetical protein
LRNVLCGLIKRASKENPKLLADCVGLHQPHAHHVAEHIQSDSLAETLSLTADETQFPLLERRISSNYFPTSPSKKLLTTNHHFTSTFLKQFIITWSHFNQTQNFPTFTPSHRAELSPAQAKLVVRLLRVWELDFD